MTVQRTIRSLLVVALAAWMSLCCCEKRILAHAFDAGDRSTAPCCARNCCDDGGSDTDAPSDHPANCADGCCAKGAPAAPSFVPDIDLVGMPVQPWLDAIPIAIVSRGRTLTHEDLAVGEPPPRLALVISRRLRI